jgi:hypothetical protein
MPRGPKGEKRPADVIGAAIMVAKTQVPANLGLPSLGRGEGLALAHRSQLKLMYGDHHQQPQKDCCYDELDPFPVSGEEHPVHGQPPSGYHAPPNPIHYHILRLMTKHRVEPMVACAILTPSSRSQTCSGGLALGAPG